MKEITDIQKTPGSFRKFNYEGKRYIYIGRAIILAGSSWINLAVRCDDGELVTFEFSDFEWCQ